MKHRCCADRLNCLWKFHSGKRTQFISQCKIILTVCICSKCFHYTSCKFIWACCGCNDSWCGIIGIFYIFVINTCCNCSMGIYHIMTVFEDFCDCFCCFVFCTVIAIEVCKLCLHVFCDGILAACSKRLHQLCTFFCITACDTVDQTFQIAGDQNIHGW